MKNKLLKLSLIFLILAIIIFAFAFYFFHFVTDSGFTLTWHKEAGKPFIARLIGNLGVALVFGSITSLLCALVLFDGKENCVNDLKEK